MRLQLNDSNKTVITSINTQIRKAGDFDNEKKEYFMTLFINGLELRYYGNTQSKDCERDFNKLIRKGAIKIYEAPYIDEQEQAHFQGQAADCANEEKHGHVVYSILAQNGESAVFCWDYYKQTVVKQEELSQGPDLQPEENCKRDIIEAVESWANSSHSYLSQGSDYSRGYKDGLAQAKEIVLDLLKNV